MSKVMIKENVRVEVFPYVWGEENVEAQIKTCNGIEQEIKRHVDDISHTGVFWDTTYECSHCKYEWDADPETGEPLCCQAAQQEWREEVADEPK